MGLCDKMTTVNLDSRCGNPVEAGALTGNAYGRDLGRCQQLPGGLHAGFNQADMLDRRNPARNSPGHEDRAATTVRFRPGILAGACSGRIVEVRVSALVSVAKNAQAPGQATSRESRLNGGYQRRL
jgi:hypothetical protein